MYIYTLRAVGRSVGGVVLSPGHHIFERPSEILPGLFGRLLEARWGFPKISGPVLGVFVIRIIVVLYGCFYKLGAPFWLVYSFKNRFRVAI